MNVPPAAVERFMEILGKSEKKKPAPSTKTAKASESLPKKVQASTTATSTTAPTVTSKKSPSARTKTETSSYYHFKSTDKAMAAKYDAKKVEDEKKVQWKTMNGAP